MLKLKLMIEIEVEEGLTVLQACEQLDMKFQDFVIMRSCLSPVTVECV